MYGLISRAGERQEFAQLIVGQRLDDLLRHSGLCQAADHRRVGEFLGCEPVAEDVQAPNIARDTHRFHAAPKLDEPAAPCRRLDLIEDNSGSEVSDSSVEDVAVPADRSRRQALGGLGLAEEPLRQT